MFTVTLTQYSRSYNEMLDPPRIIKKVSGSKTKFISVS